MEEAGCNASMQVSLLVNTYNFSIKMETVLYIIEVVLNSEVIEWNLSIGTMEIVVLII